MAVDPALLWYFNDWHGGTITMSRHMKGAYMDLLYAQFNNGHLSIDEIKTVLGSDFGSTWPTIQKKFKQDDNGLFFNPRLELEHIRRKGWTKSRKENASSDKKHMPEHMENENEIENKCLEERKISFYKLLEEKFSEAYPSEMIKNFCDYWTEHNEKGKKMRFEMQKVFHISRRLATWYGKSQSNNFGRTKINSPHQLEKNQNYNESL